MTAPLPSKIRIPRRANVKLLAGRLRCTSCWAQGKAITWLGKETCDICGASHGWDK